MANRQSIDSIANALISRLNKMEKVTERIEIASQREQKVDVSELRELMESQTRRENEILESINAVKKKNETRVPNWLIVVMAVFYLTSLGFMLYAWNKAETYDEAVQRANYFEQEYNKLKQ